MAKQLSYFRNICNEINSKEQNFKDSCNQSMQNLKSWLDDSYKNTEKIFTQSDLFCMNLKIEGNNNRSAVQNNSFRSQEMQKWIELKKMTIDLQQKDLQMATQLNESLKKSKQAISLKSNGMISKQNNKKMRLDKVDQFIKNCQASNPPARQFQQRRMYTPKSRQNSEPDIEFCPQSRQLIFRIQTFEGKIAEFILFFEEEERKYGLKNPFKNLKSLDLMAVKNFNIHHDKLRLYEEFRAIVVKCIDNAEDVLYN